MTATSDNDVGLLIMPEQKSIVPVALSAFHVTQSSRKKLKEYNDTILIKNDGTALRIKDIKLREFWGTSVSRKILSALTGARRIEVKWEDVQNLDLSSIKQWVSECLLHDSQQEDPYLPQKAPIDEVIDKVHKSSSISDIFRAIDIPPASDSLDVL